MFALIEIQGATHVAIHVPNLGSDKTLPALAGMLEHNAVFIKQGYNTLETCKPKMSIILGDQYFIEGREAELAVVIPESGCILGEDFVLESPEVKISKQKAIDRRDAEIKRLRTELEHTKQQLQDLQDKINAAAETDEP